jgi:hypothetical protein
MFRKSIAQCQVLVPGLSDAPPGGNLRRSSGSFQECRFADIALNLFCGFVLVQKKIIKIGPLLLNMRLETKTKRFTHDFQLRLCNFSIFFFALALRGGFCSLESISVL